MRRCIDARTALRESRAFLLDPTDFPYRTCRALVTYGDDTLKNTAKGVLFSKLDMYEVLENELGLSLTNGKKEKKQEKLPLAEVSFLKRSIVYDQELGRYLCPITKKTIAKMLVA